MRCLRDSTVAAVMVVALALCGHAQKARGAAAVNPPLFAFWYEDWRPDTWAKLQPANVIVGVPPQAVAEIHAHGGRALRYVTFYQARLGTEFVRDQSDLENVGFRTSSGFLSSAFGGRDNYVLCSNSSELRRRVLAYVEKTLQKEGYDGLFVDNAYLTPARDEVCDAKHRHSSPGLKGGAAYIDLMAEVRATAKELKPGAMIVSNPGNPQEADQLRSAKQTLWDVSDYVMWESYGFSSLLGSGHDRWANTLQQSRKWASSSRAPQILALSYPRNFAEALHSFAVARLFGFAYAANLGERDFQREQEGGHFGVFLQRLPLELGNPRDAWKEAQRGILHRNFDHGEIFLNVGTVPAELSISHSGTLYSDTAATSVRAGAKITLAANGTVAVLNR